MTNNLQELIGLHCNEVEHGQSAGMLVIHFKNFKLNIECSWIFRNHDEVISSNKVLSSNNALPRLEGHMISNIEVIGDNPSDIRLLFENDSMLEIKQDNIKYEAWQLYKNNKLVLIAGPNSALSNIKDD